MESSPTPLERLLHLEQDMEHLRSLLALPQPQEEGRGSPAPRSIWPGDELLLTRILRRTPIALTAYQGAADLIATERRGLRLTNAAGASSYQFCELVSGDAVVWIQPNPPAWIWRSPTVARLFHIPPDLDDEQEHMQQTLPLFKPVVRHQQWTLFRQGEIVPQPRPFFEQAEQANQLRRMETLERRVNQIITKYSMEISEIHQQLTVLKDLLNRLQRLSVEDH